jgi:hypothetical protein
MAIYNLLYMTREVNSSQDGHHGYIYSDLHNHAVYTLINITIIMPIFLIDTLLGNAETSLGDAFMNSILLSIFIDQQLFPVHYFLYIFSTIFLSMLHYNSYKDSILYLYRILVSMCQMHGSTLVLNATSSYRLTQIVLPLRHTMRSHIIMPYRNVVGTGHA